MKKKKIKKKWSHRRQSNEGIKLLKNKYEEAKIYWILLIIILLIGFGIRFHGALVPHNYTFDEGVYVRLGMQMNKNLFNYSTIPLYNQYKKTQPNRKLPEHYKSPLFVHPPLYSMFCALFISLNLNPQNDPMKVASVVSVVFGSLSIFLIFLIGRYLYGNYLIGLIAAFFLMIDPVHWILSQKIWIESTLTFFVLLALLFYLKGIENNKWFKYAGICSGFALLSKYPGGMCVFSFFAFMAVFDQKVFVSKKFWISILITTLIFFPWVLWNIIVYLTHSSEFSFHKRGVHVYIRFFKIMMIPVGLIIVYYILFLLKWVDKGVYYCKYLIQKITENNLKRIIFALYLIIIAVFFKSDIFHTLSFEFLPQNGWNVGAASDSRNLFYLRKIMEFSFIHYFALFSVLFIHKKEEAFMVFYMICFYLFYEYIQKGFETRYIMPIIPIMILLGSNVLYIFIKKISFYSFYKKSFYYSVLSILIFWGIMRIFQIGHYLAWNNTAAIF